MVPRVADVERTRTPENVGSFWNAARKRQALRISFSAGEVFSKGVTAGLLVLSSAITRSRVEPFDYQMRVSSKGPKIPHLY